MNPESERLHRLLALRHAPVAIAFRSAPPPGLARVSAGAPSGCTYWKLAARGESFYTEASDHLSCPVGAYIHGIELNAEAERDLAGLVETMLELSYLRAEEVATMPRRRERFQVAVYSPASSPPCAPDVILVVGNARQLMLLGEAAQAANIDMTSLVGRPTCAAIPEVMRSARSVTNLGCIGNRVYTELEDGEFYFAFSGSLLGVVTDRLATIVAANEELEKFHRARV